MEKTFWQSIVRNQFVPFAAILAVSLIVAALVGAWTAFSIKSLDNTLSVTGSAKTQVEADAVRLSFTISRTTGVAALAEGNQLLETDTKAVRDFLSQNAVPDAEVTINPVMTSQVYDNDASAPLRYTLSRTVTINSTRVPEIGALAQNLSVLSNAGVVAQANPPEYYYSKLSELRVSLLGEAVKDAQARAEAIASQSGQSVGRLQSSTSGVVQILAPNSVDVSDYGQYDTSSVKKEVMITVRATFYLD